MLAPRRAFLDPALERLLLRAGQRAVRLRRRHHLVLVRAENARDQIRARGVAGLHDRHAVLRAIHTLLAIEPQLGLALVRILAVAVVAILREDRLHIAAEIERRRRPERRGAE